MFTSLGAHIHLVYLNRRELLDQKFGLLIWLSVDYYCPCKGNLTLLESVAMYSMFSTEHQREHKVTQLHTWSYLTAYFFSLFKKLHLYTVLLLTSPLSYSAKQNLSQLHVAWPAFNLQVESISFLGGLIKRHTSSFPNNASCLQVITFRLIRQEQKAFSTVISHLHSQRGMGGKNLKNVSCSELQSTL